MDGYKPDDEYKPRKKPVVESFRGRKAVIIGSSAGPMACIVNHKNPDGTFDVRTGCCRRTVSSGELIMDAVIQIGGAG